MARSKVNIGIGLVGPGLIGSAFLRQLSVQKPKLLKHHNIDPHVLGIIGSTKMLINPHGIDLLNWKQIYEGNVSEANLQVFFQEIKESKGFNGHVFIDSSATEAVPEYYSQFFEAGCHVVTPNKKFGSGSFQRYQRGRQLCQLHGSQFFYEATVGAGLPVISTLQGMLDSGDEIQSIEGVFSGTLSYIFNEVSKEKSFSQIVAKAKELGFTEPDPRDDLAGMDVARKVVVLARECGMEIELSDLTIQSLVPEKLQNISDVQTFMDELPNYDEEMLAMISEADAAGEVLRYVGVINVKEQKCEVALRRYPSDHALGGLVGTDNMIIFKTERYNAQPLVIRGPGAGAEPGECSIDFDDVINHHHRHGFAT